MVELILKKRKKEEEEYHGFGVISAVTADTYFSLQAVLRKRTFTGRGWKTS